MIFLSSNEEERQLYICGCWWGSWYRKPSSNLCEWSRVETNGDNARLGFSGLVTLNLWKKMNLLRWKIGLTRMQDAIHSQFHVLRRVDNIRNKIGSFGIWKMNESWWVARKVWARRKTWQSYRNVKVTRGWEGTSQFRAWAISPDFILDEQMRVQIEGSSSGMQVLSQMENLSFLSTSMSRPSLDRFVCIVVEVCGLKC